MVDNFSRALPFITVVMPIRDEAAFIARSLGAVLAQDYPPDRMEVIVADGMSTDCTRAIVEAFQEEHSNILLIDNPKRIVPTALNIGIRAAQGDIIVRVDGHTTIAPDYVLQCVEALKRTGVDNVGGRICAQAPGYFGKAVALATSSPFGVGKARTHYSNDEKWVDTVYMGAYNREVFHRIGLFDEEMIRDQDDEFNYRLLAHGRRILLCPKIHSRYINRSSPQKLWRQYFEYGFWKVRVLQKHFRQMRPRQFVPPLFVAALFGSLLLSFFFPIGRVLLSLVGGSYLLANLAVSIWTARKNGWRYVLPLPLVYATLHLSWGMGFLAGLVRFWNRWGDTRTHVQISPSDSAVDQ